MPNQRAAKNLWPLIRNGQLDIVLDLIFVKVSDIISKSPFPFFLYYNRFLILKYELNRGQKRRKLSSIEIRLATASDLSALEQLVARGDEINMRIARGDLCFIASSNDKIVGMVWVRITDQHVETLQNYRVVLPPHSCWLFDGYIAPQYRLRGVWVNLMAEINGYLKCHGVQEAYCMINSINSLSLQTHLAFGFQIQTQVRYLKLMGIHIHIIRALNGPAGRKYQVQISRKLK